MTAPCEPAYLEPGLVYINLPRMDVKYGRSTSLRVVAEGSANDAKGKLPEVASAGGRGPESEDMSNGHRQLKQTAGIPDDDVRHHSGSGVAVTSWAPNRKQAGVVTVAFLQQDIESPFQPRKNREGRSPKAKDRFAAGILQGVLRLPHVLPKLIPSHRGNPAMPEPVRGDFVTGSGNPPHQLGETTCHPSQREERAIRAVPSQEVEQHIGVSLHPAGIGVPIGAIHDALERADLEVVLHVYREDVGRVENGRE